MILHQYVAKQGIQKKIRDNKTLPLINFLLNYAAGACSAGAGVATLDWKLSNS